jgi:hypothetical protein
MVLMEGEVDRLLKNQHLSTCTTPGPPKCLCSTAIATALKARMVHLGECVDDLDKRIAENIQRMQEAFDAHDRS